MPTRRLGRQLQMDGATAPLRRATSGNLVKNTHIITKGIIEKQLNTNLGRVKVQAVADTSDTIHVVVPYMAKEGELSDSDLEKVAGGKQDITANCSVFGGLASAANTVTQLNLG